MSKKLQNKVAVITGASKGIGAAIAKYLAKEGASVVVNYSRSKDEADNVVKAIKKDGGKAIAVRANVSNPDEIKNLFKETLDAFGKIDILVNNAGVYEFAPLEQDTPEMFHKMFDLNVLGLLLLSKEAVHHFNSHGGSIVNIGSVAGTTAPINSSIYSATKAAVDAITLELSKELGPRRIRVNSVNPGMVETEGFLAAGIDKSDFRKEVEAKTPLGRIGKPDDIAPVVAFLVSDEAAWITGERIAVSGGSKG